MRTLKFGNVQPQDLRVYFDVRDLSGNPLLTEAGGQPQINISGGGWTPTGIGTLVSMGFGRYYADMDSNVVQQVGDVILTTYQNPGISKITPGDSFQVVEVITTTDNDDSGITNPPVIDVNFSENFSEGNAGTISEAPVAVIKDDDDDTTAVVAQPTLAAKAFDCYTDTNEADIYFSTRVNVPLWSSTDPDQKLAALRDATRLIDRLNFAGCKTDSSQLLQFPRGEDRDVPADIKIATCEIAYKLLDGVDPDLEIDALNADSHGYGNVKTNYNRKFIPEHTLAGIPSARAWSYLVPYLRDPNSLSLTRSS